MFVFEIFVLCIWSANQMKSMNLRLTVDSKLINQFDFLQKLWKNASLFNPDDHPVSAALKMKLCTVSSQFETACRNDHGRINKKWAQHKVLQTCVHISYFPSRTFCSSGVLLSTRRCSRSDFFIMRCLSAISRRLLWCFPANKSVLIHLAIATAGMWVWRFPKTKNMPARFDFSLSELLLPFLLWIPAPVSCARRALASRGCACSKDVLYASSYITKLQRALHSLRNLIIFVLLAFY